MSPRAPADVGELPDLDGASAEYILTWAIERFFPEIAVACSMQDAVLVDLAWRVDPRIEIFFLETGFHFPETLETAERMRKRYQLNLVALKPAADPAVYSRDGYEACCAARKVAPMEAHLQGKRAWASGLRRAESSSRATAKARARRSSPGNGGRTTGSGTRRPAPRTERSHPPRSTGSRTAGPAASGTRRSSLLCSSFSRGDAGSFFP